MGSSAQAVEVKPGHTTAQNGEGHRNPNEGILDMLRLGEAILTLRSMADSKRTNERRVTVELQEEERKVDPNTFRIAAFARAIEAISRIGETIKSGDDYVLEVRFVPIYMYSANVEWNVR